MRMAIIQGTYATIVRNLITDNGAGNDIHNEPDIAFDTAYFDISFIGSKGFAEIVVVGVNKGLDDNRSGSGVVGHLLMGNLNVIEILERLSGFSQ